MPDIGYYTLPVILSFDGVDKQVNSTLGKSLGSIAKKGGADFGKQLGEGIKASESDVKRALDGYSKLYDKAADQAGKLKVAQAGITDLENKGVTSGKRWEAAQAAKAKATRDNERALREARDAYSDYEKAAKSAESAGDNIGGGFLDRLKGLAGSAKDSGGEAASGFVEGFGGPIAALGARGGPIGLGLAAAAALATGAGVLIGQQVMAGMEREVQADRLAGQLGLSEDQSAKFGKASGEIYSQNFGESLGDVGQAMADVTSTLGQAAPSDVIEDMTKKALTFRDVFGTEVSESIAFAQNLITNGLAPDAASAFDMMTTAFQRVPSAMRDELPEILSEYATYFQSLGFSGEEAFGLLVKTAPQGKIALDKVGDALKEFTLLATDLGDKNAFGALTESLKLDAGVVSANLLAGGDTAQAQFDQIIDGLLAIKDPVEQAEAALGLFGTPLEDLDKAKIPAFLQSLNNADQAMQGFSGSAQNLVDTVGDNAAGSIESAKRSVETAAGGMQDALAQAFGPSITAGAEFITAHTDDIAVAFAYAAEGGKMFGSVLVGTVGTVIKVWGEMISAIGDGIGFVVDGFEVLTGGLASVAEAVGADGLASSLRSAESQLGATSDGLHRFGEDTARFGDATISAAINLGQMNTGLDSTKNSAANAAGQVDNVVAQISKIPGAKQIDITAVVKYIDVNGLAISPDQLRTPTFTPAVPGEAQRPRGGGRADGGSILGPGGPKSDIIPIWASNGEHMLPADEVKMLGGQSGVYSLRNMIRSGAFGKFANGGAINQGISFASAVGDGRAYKYGGVGPGFDCSGYMSSIYAALTGKPQGTRYFTTESDFEALGFVKGNMPGAFNIGVRRGGGGKLSHMAGTLPNGVNVESGGAHNSTLYGGDAAGADAFPLQYYLPVGGGDPSNAATGSGGSTLGGMPSTGTAGVGPNGEAGTYTVDQASVAEANSRVAEADAKVRESEAKQRELAADAKESDRIRAQADVDKSKADAQKARQELAEAKQGKFTAGKAAAGGGKSGGPEMSEIGSIFSSFMGETFGLDGSLFPDIGNLMPVKMLGTLLGAFGGGGEAAATSSAPFGVPDVAVPTAPVGSAASGSGLGPLPGPQNVTNIDNSINAGTVGWDPAQAEKRQKQGYARAIQRIPVAR